MMAEPTGKVHELKCAPAYFQAVLTGDKPFELRKDDRGGYRVGDTLWLREWSEDGGYSGHSVLADVTYVLKDGPWLAPGYAALGIVVVSVEAP